MKEDDEKKCDIQVTLLVSKSTLEVLINKNKEYSKFLSLQVFKLFNSSYEIMFSDNIFFTSKHFKKPKEEILKAIHAGFSFIQICLGNSEKCYID